MNRNGAVDYNGADRISKITTCVTNYGSTNVVQTLQYVWHVLNTDTSLLVASNDVSTDALDSSHTAFGVTSKSRTVYEGNGNRYVTNIAGDGSLSIRHYLHGLLQSVRRMDTSTQLSELKFTHDAHGRQATASDARNGATTYNYDGADRRTSLTTPVPGTGQSPQTTATTYDSAGRVIRILYADGTSLTNEHYLSGELKRSTGSRTYPVEYTYDAQGRMTNMTTWRDYPNSGSAVTTWKYDGARDFLTNKLYAGDATGIAYTYTKGGRPLTRAWQRGITTTYETNAAGETIRITYSSGASNVTYNLDRLGRRTNIAAFGGGGGHSPPYFCPNGPFANRFYYEWDAIPDSCWENGVKPNPRPNGYP